MSNKAWRVNDSLIVPSNIDVKTSCMAILSDAFAQSTVKFSIENVERFVRTHCVHDYNTYKDKYVLDVSLLKFVKNLMPERNI